VTLLWLAPVGALATAAGTGRRLGSCRASVGVLPYRVGLRTV